MYANDLAGKIRRCRNLTDREKELLSAAIESAPHAAKVIATHESRTSGRDPWYALGAWQTVTDALTELVNGE